MTVFYIGDTEINTAKFPDGVEVAYCSVCGSPIGGVNTNFTDDPVLYCPDCLLELEPNEEV